MNRRTFELAASAAALTALLVGGAIPAGADDLPSSVLAVAPMAPVEVLGDSFPSVLQAMQDTAAPRLQATADDGAVGRSGKGRMVWSSVPLEADGKPVQRALRVSGGTAEPANPLVDARLPLDASEPVVVGSGAGRFTFTAIGADDGAERVVGDGVLHQDTHRETDSIVRAVTGGAESYELISGTGAPQEFRYRVTGATPHADPSGDVMLIADGNTIGRVQAPVVVDSAGHDVAASLSVDGDVVVFHVAHRSAGVAYPVLADPTWLAGYNFLAAGEGADGLTYENPTGQYRIAAVTGGNLPGITIKPFGGSHVYTVADRAIATFTAPPGSTIDKVAFKGVHRRNDSDRQTMRLGLYKADPALLGKAKDYSDTVTALDEDEVLLDDESDTSRFAVIEMFTPPCTVADPCQAISANNGTRVTVENLEVTLVDNGAPSFQWTGTLPQLGSGWVKAEGTETLGMEGFDDGSGVRTLSANQVQGAATPLLLNPKTMACDDLHQPGHGAFPCPEQPPFEEQDVVLSSLLEGRVQIVGHATDYVNNADDGSSPKLMLRLDKSAPAVVRLFGSLVDGAADRWTQLHGTVEANVEAADRYSGVKDVDLSITPVDPAGTPDSQPLPACGQPGDNDQPCPTSVTTGADIDGDALPDGTLEVAATAHDYVGYDSQVATKRVYKDNTPPAATAKGELTRLEDQWTASTANTAVTLQGKDRRSGISRLQLYARDDNGKRLIDDIQVCDPATANAATGADACPLTVSQSTTVDLGDLATGQVTLEAYATDAAGNRDPSPDSWDTYVDHDPPGEVGRITAIRPKSGPTRVSWTPAVDDGSGLDGYEYRLTDDSGTTGEWVTTPTPGAPIPTELQHPLIEVRAKDKTGNRGPGKLQQFSFAAKKPLGPPTCPTAKEVNSKVKDGYFNVAGADTRPLLAPAANSSTDTEPRRRKAAQFAQVRACFQQIGGGVAPMVRLIVPIDLFGLPGSDSARNTGPQRRIRVARRPSA